jgi:hypothetical protein
LGDGRRLLGRDRVAPGGLLVVVVLVRSGGRNRALMKHLQVRRGGADVTIVVVEGAALDDSGFQNNIQTPKPTVARTTTIEAAQPRNPGGE